MATSAGNNFEHGDIYLSNSSSGSVPAFAYDHSTQRIGIKTNTPSRELDVNGDLSGSDGLFFGSLSVGSVGTLGVQLLVNSGVFGSAFGIERGGNRMVLTHPGGTGVPISWYANGSLFARYYMGDGAVGTGSVTRGDVEFVSFPGSQTLFLDYSSGKVSIGKRYGDTELDVVGNGSFTGSITSSAFYGYGGSLTGIGRPMLTVAQDGTGDYNGSTHTVIQQALTSIASTGGTVYVRGGIYSIGSTVLISSNTTLIGDGANTVFQTIDGLNSHTIRNYTYGSDNIYDNNIHVANLKIIGGALGSQTADLSNWGVGYGAVRDCSIINVIVGSFIDCGIGIVRGQNTIVERCHVNDARFGIATFSDSYGTKIINNEAHNCFRYGIELKDGHDSIISNNTCFDNGEFGIGIFDSSESASVPSRNIIIGNICKDANYLTNGYGAYTGSAGTGISVYYETGEVTAREVIITNNICTGNLYNGIRSYFPRTIIANNIMSSNGYYGGLMTVSAENLLLTGNQIYGNGQDGFQLNGGCRKAVITNNLFSNNGSTSANTYANLYISNGNDGALISNNSFEGTNLKYHIQLLAALTSLSIVSNVFYESPTTSYTNITDYSNYEYAHNIGD